MPLVTDTASNGSGSPADRIYIREAAEMLNRRPATLRMWEREDLLPKRLRSHRSERGWRYWLPDQIQDIGKWMIDEDMRPGRGLEHYHPTPEKLAAHLEGQRLPRKNRAERLGVV
jgi:hypothetical protein